MGAIFATACAFRCCNKKSSCDGNKYSIPNQPLRFAQAKANGNTRMLDIDQHYKPEHVRGKVVVVTGKSFVIFFQLFNSEFTTRTTSLHQVVTAALD